jgi:ketosteroid isomerase-like protein
MTADRPEQVLELFATALNDRDVDAALALYEPEATFAPRPGEEVSGLPAIRGALEQFAALDPRLKGEITKVLTADGVALVQNRWQLEGTQADGTPVALRGHSTDVLDGHRTAAGGS